MRASIQKHVRNVAQRQKKHVSVGLEPIVLNLIRMPPKHPAVDPLAQQRMDVVIPHLKKLFPKAGMMLRHTTPWELLVAVVLSAQCTDKKVNSVTETLFKKYPTFGHYLRADLPTFEQDIKPTGFYHSKAKNILATARIIEKEYGGRIPDTMEQLVVLPGVGRKTANILLGNIYGVVEGIAVDTHVRRLSRLFGLTTHMEPVKIERDLMTLLPKKEWFLFTYRMIEYGRTYCTARCKHGTCPIYHALRTKQFI